MTQNAVVKRRLDQGKVEILVRRQSACGHDCDSCSGGCPSMVKEPEMTAVAVDALGAQPGQRVTVESSTRRVLGLAVLVYLLPFVAFFVGYFLMRQVSEPAAILTAIGAFLVILLGACMPLDRLIRRRKPVTFRVISLEG